MNTDVKTAANQCVYNWINESDQPNVAYTSCMLSTFFKIKTLKPLADRVVLLGRVNYILLNLKNKSKCSRNDSDM